MKRLLTWLSRRRFPYTPLITVEISRSRLLHNLQEFQKLAPEGRIAPVLKSNAYGHGVIEVATILEKQRRKDGKNGQDKIPFLIVDSYFEAVALRSRGFKTPLLIIGYNRPETLLRSRLSHVAFTITTMDTLREIISTRRPIRIHLKIDTGMHRQGILPEEVPDAISLLLNSRNIILEGICTHLSDADGSDPSFTHRQINIWNKLVGQFRKEFLNLKWIHASATYGHPFSKEISANVSRLGIGLYGLAENIPGMFDIELQPALEMKTLITSIKTLKQGESIGYNNTFKASRDMRVATIPAGYYEGIDRRLSSAGYILIGLQRIPCPIVGRVSMNITSIDVSNVPDIKMHDVAIVISNQSTDPNSISSIVKNTPGTIPYEMVINVPNHLKRMVM